ncbi:biotin/lipoyl-binding protein [Thiotrichales bacterium 19S3-7]|nr:biotin/lipoyl-binding protein [Thiotrichales bacterium 19S3-7]MCF6800627.1 biotin/lipoyl-binding protein [Thiotrichales bacterium 19S3-11]
MKIYFQKKFTITVIIALIVIVISLSLILFKSSADSTADKDKGIYIEVEAVTLGQYHPVVLISATAISRVNTAVSSFLKSRVEMINFKVGQRVKKGQLLMELDSEVYEINLAKEQASIDLIKVKLDKNNVQCKLNRSQLTQAQSLLELAKSHYQRLKSLRDSTYSSQAELDLADEKVLSMQSQYNQKSYDLENCLLNSNSLSAELNQANANLRLAEKNLKETKVYAPYNGVITDQYVSVGRTVNQSERLFSIYNPNATELEGVITHQLYQVLEKLNYDEISACADLNDQANCYQLKRISDNISKLGTGHIAYFANTQKGVNIAHGKTIKLYLKLPNITAFKVPVSAIYNDKYVYSVAQNHLLKKQVVLAGRWMDNNGHLYQLIKPGALKTGDLVMLSHIPGARTGLAVTYQRHANSNRAHADEVK